MHKKILFISIAWLCAITGMAQNLEIRQDFKISENSSAAIMYHNQFGKYEKPAMDDTFPYAVVRVLLEGNAHEVKEAKKMLGIYTGVLSQGVKATYLDFENEMLFLVPSSSGHVELSCGEGCARKTILELPRLQSNAVYVGKVHYTPMQEPVQSTTTQAPKRQFFKFRVSPADAIVEIDVNGQKDMWHVSDGVASKPLNYGTYHYTISANRYHTESGTFSVSDTQTEKTVALQPKFGWLSITSSNAQDAYVYVTNTQTGTRQSLGTLPVNRKDLDSGTYTLLIQKDKYKDYTTNFTIEEGKTTTLNPTLEANFAQVTLTTNEGTDIYVDGSRLGTTHWTGTLELGEYVVETRKANHRSSYTALNVSDSDTNQKIQLKAPIPIIGSLSVDGSPVKAAIYVDDKYVGESPMIVNDLLIGEHQIKVDKDGYAVWKKMVTVAENEEGVVTYELEKGISLDRVVLKGLNATKLSVKREGGETFVFTYNLPKKGPVRLRMSTDGYTYTTQKNVQGDVDKEIDKGEGYQMAWTIPEDLGQAMQDSLYFQIEVLPELPKEKIKIGSLYYQAVNDGTSVEVAKGEYNFTGVDIPSKIKYKGYEYPVTNIGESAFKDCKKLTSISIPNSVTSIGEDAFKSCYDLTSIIIPNSVTSIGSSAFGSCIDLTSISIPNSVTSIGNNAFESCYDLMSISVDKNNPIYDSRNDCNAIIETKTNTLIAGCKNTVIPNSVTSIGNKAFRGCYRLTSITIPNSVTSIGENAFSWCKNLTSISIPNSVTSIGKSAFSWCDDLRSISVDKNNPIYDSRNDCNAIIETKTNTLIAGCKNTVIPNSVTSIGEDAFDGCDNLTSITIPNSVTSIGENAFSGCDELTSITIPNSVTSIGRWAFSSCDNLTSITIPNSVTSIGYGAFNYCDKLKTIYIPRGTKAKFAAMEGLKGHVYKLVER